MGAGYELRRDQRAGGLPNFQKSPTQVCIGCGCGRWVKRAENRVLLRFWCLWHCTFDFWRRKRCLSCRTLGNQWQQFCAKTETPVRLVWCKISRRTGFCSSGSSFPWRAEFFLRTDGLSATQKIPKCFHNSWTFIIMIREVPPFLSRCRGAAKRWVVLAKRNAPTLIPRSLERWRNRI
jgi:hypothetical protein